MLLFLIEIWPKKDYNIITESIISKLPKILFFKFSTIVISELLKKRIEIVHKSLLDLILYSNEELQLRLIKHESTLQLLILFQSLQNETDKLLLKEFIKRSYFNYQCKNNYELLAVYNKWCE